MVCDGLPFVKRFSSYGGRKTFFSPWKFQNRGGKKTPRSLDICVLQFRLAYGRDRCGPYMPTYRNWSSHLEAKGKGSLSNFSKSLAFLAVLSSEYSTGYILCVLKAAGLTFGMCLGETLPYLFQKNQVQTSLTTFRGWGVFFPLFWLFFPPRDYIHKEKFDFLARLLVFTKKSSTF